MKKNLPGLMDSNWFRQFPTAPIHGPLTPEESQTASDSAAALSVFSHLRTGSFGLGSALASSGEIIISGISH